MAQGTDSEAAWKIAEGGFGLVTSDTDPGWFGKGLQKSKITKKKTRKKLKIFLKKSLGIYFTSSFEYALRYALTKAGSNKKPEILICAIIPGNIYPVSDMSLLGTTFQNGYQSNFAIGSFLFTK